MIWSLVQPVQSRPLYNELFLKDTESTPTNTTCSTCNPKQQTDAFDHEFYTPPPLSLHARARLVRALSFLREWRWGGLGRCTFARRPWKPLCATPSPRMEVMSNSARIGSQHFLSPPLKQLHLFMWITLLFGGSTPEICQRGFDRVLHGFRRVGLRYHEEVGPCKKLDIVGLELDVGRGIVGSQG